MQLDQAFDVNYSLPVVWRALEDLRATASCIPGAEITNVEDNQKASGIFRVQLGPIKAAFAGDAEVTRDDATHAGTIKGAGRDGKNASRVNASVEYQLSSVNDNTTRITLKVDYSMTGTLAQFSRGGLVKEIAASITKIFAGNLEKMLAANVAPAPVPGSGENTTAHAVPPILHNEPQSLNVFTLIFSAFGRWIAGFFKPRQN
ncbi:MAG: SRPBCC family protein [Afipia sp.]|nr:SRPBCC family protein [Afipia sp.]